VWVYAGWGWEQNEVHGDNVKLMGRWWEQKDFDRNLMETKGI